jgi:hypothetical protein
MKTRMLETVSAIRLDRKACIITSLASGIGGATELEPAEHGNVVTGGNDPYRRGLQRGEL